MSFYKIFFLSIFIILPIKVYPINSISKDINIINSGLELYKKKCSNCHGVNAQGKSNGFFLSPNLKVFQKGYINFINIIVNGYGRMPAWGGNVELTEEQINQLASYLASISSEEANWQ
ncbi:MAG: hypothetical protein CML36_02110 [Rhodobacteraceae bacterium]|nr:hypothetical protein [Paracoccaceae bacterium]OUU62514.1 MAG: hypothetical protein CBC22_04300 [Alphaproteobacteria bacterium TMED62]|tara:strand:+ start:3558 stop:3911 length:354 start_codon:yes stop_codon:yes gene_type:complete